MTTEAATDEVVAAVAPGLDELITQTMADQRVVGAAVGIVRDQQLAWSGGYGHADFDDARPPDEHTIFRVDSNTKPVTGTAIMQLRDEGALHLDDPLVEYVPEFGAVREIAGRVGDVTLRRLLAHRSGLNGEVPGTWHATGVGPTIEEVLDRLHECALVIPPDSQHKYCNLGFVLLGEVASRVTGMPYGEYVRQHILDPLGMTDSTFEPEAAERRRVTQYAWSPTSGRQSPARDLTFNGREPAGGLHSTITDLAKWIALQFRRDRQLERGGAQILAGTSIEEMHRPQYADDDWTGGLCIAWSAVRRGDHIYLGHGGGNPGSLSRTLFHAGTKTGVVVLTNSDGHTAQGELALEILDRLVTAGRARPAPLPPPPAPPPPEAARFIGLYASASGETGYGGPRRVAWLNGGLALLGPGVDLPREIDASGGGAMPCHLEVTEDPLVLRARDGRLAGELLAFREDGAGALSAFESIGLVFHRLEVRP
jgi:CubicO group peptidase (beta-lactamase class C family)